MQVPAVSCVGQDSTLRLTPPSALSTTVHQITAGEQSETRENYSQLLRRFVLAPVFVVGSPGGFCPPFVAIDKSKSTSPDAEGVNPKHQKLRRTPVFLFSCI